MVGLLPPSSSVIEVKCLLAACITIFPTAVDPVKKICSNRKSKSCFAVSTPPKATKASSSGKILPINSAMTLDVSGVCSEGFIITVFPAAIAFVRGCKVKNIG